MRTALWLLGAALLIAEEPHTAILEREFAGIFTASGKAQGQEISPIFVAGDFNGDGRRDLAILVSFSASKVEPAPIPGLIITKVLDPSAGPRDAKDAQMGLAELAQRYRKAIVLLIVEDADRAGGAGIPRRYALVDFANNGKIRMSASRRPLKRTAAGDGPVVPAPRLKGDAIRFLDDRGEGTAVYWDGARYLWYPI